MAEIITNENWIELDGARLQKGSRDLYFIPGGVSLRVAGSSSKIDVLVEGTTIDGAPVADRDELMAFFEAQGFNDGGGDGSGVTWDQVTDKPLYTLETPIQDAEGLIPVYTQNGQLPVGMPEFPENAIPLILLDVRVPELEQGNFLVGGVSGNEQRKISPMDLGATAGLTGVRVISIQSDAFTYAYALASAPVGSTLVYRTSTGQGKFAASINADEAIVQSQFSGVINDTLTASETSATLNTAYPTATVGFTVVTVTGLTEYRKISPTAWTKKTIETV